MNTTLILIGFALSVLMGAGLASLFVTVKPDWSTRRRQLTAASILPAITAGATVLGILLIVAGDHGQNERMERLAIVAMTAIGGGFSLLALVGGLIGAFLSGRRRRP